LRPLAVLTALIFGSAAAISFGLTATAVVFLVLGSEEPRLADELPSLIRSCGWFLVLAGVSGTALYATLKELKWRWAGQAAMWLSLVLIGWVFWPT